MNACTQRATSARGQIGESFSHTHRASPFHVGFGATWDSVVTYRFHFQPLLDICILHFAGPPPDCYHHATLEKTLTRSYEPLNPHPLAPTPPPPTLHAFLFSTLPHPTAQNLRQGGRAASSQQRFRRASLCSAPATAATSRAFVHEIEQRRAHPLHLRRRCTWIRPAVSHQTEFSRLACRTQLQCHGLARRRFPTAHSR